MISFFIWILTAALVLDSVFLILLVLVQLPKKDAGAGMAFGGGTADALFGAGSGNVLTKITKWATAIFFALAILLGVLQSRAHRKTSMLAGAPLPTLTESRVPATQPTTPAASTTNQSLVSTSGQNLSTLTATNVSTNVSENVSTNVSVPQK